MRFAGTLLCLLSITAAAQQPAADDPLNAAITEQQQGDYQAAIRDYRKVLQSHPDMVEAKVNLGAALAHVGQFDEAIAMYKSALPTLPFKNPVLLNLGLAYYKKGDFANAREQFEALHQLQPKDTRVAILLGDTDLRLQKSADAVALMEPLAPANADNPDFQYVYGSALIASGRRRDGVPHVEKVAQSGNSPDAYLLAGATLLQLNDFEPARKDLEAALRLNPKLPNIYTLVGTVRDKTGDAKDAEPAFREALKSNPDDFDANLYLGAILYKRRQMDEAKIYLDRALKLNPTYSLARYEAAMLKSTAGEYEAAVQDLEKLIKDDPQWLDPHVQLATLYYKLHRPEDGARERQLVDRLTAEQQSRGPDQ
jgi:tetratricopeptide (TPR) repeat protein